MAVRTSLLLVDRAAALLFVCIIVCFGGASTTIGAYNASELFLAWRNLIIIVIDVTLIITWRAYIHATTAATCEL
jgi:hypothetical protein